MSRLTALVTMAATTACTSPSSPQTLRTLYGLEPPEEVRAAATALVLVDVQREFEDGPLHVTGVRAAADRARDLLAWARKEGMLVVHVRQVARSVASKVFARGSRGAEPMDGFDPCDGEWVVEKAAGGAFTAPDLEARLRARGIERLVVAGFMTHLAVAATATDAATRGFAVIVAADATATRDLPATDGLAPFSGPFMQRAALAALADRAADVLPVDQVARLHVVP